MIKINVTESASLVTEHPENTLSPSFFSTFCYVTALFQNGWNQFFTSKFYLHKIPIMNTEKHLLKICPGVFKKAKINRWTVRSTYSLFWDTKS